MVHTHIQVICIDIAMCLAVSLLEEYFVGNYH